MTPHPDTPSPPPAGTGFDLLGVRHQLAEAAARGLSLFAGAFGGLLLVASLLQMALAPSGGGLEGQRALLGLVICTGAGIGFGLRRSGRPSAAAAAMVMLFGGAVVMHAGLIGLGLYSTALTGLCLLVAVAGMMLGPRMAVALTVAYALSVSLLAWAEMQGWIAGRAVLGTLPVAERVVGHAMLGAAGLLVALLLYRQVTGMVQAAVAEQHRLAELLGIGIDWTWEMDAQGRLTQVSDGFEKSTGRSVAEFMRLGQPGGPTVADTPGLREWRAALRARRPYRDVEITLRCTDGTEIHLRGNGRPVQAADGTLRGWIGVSRNVTAEVEAGRERARAQRLIDRSRAESHAILEHASVGIALVRQRRFERVNPALEQMLGRAPGSLQGRPVTEVLGGRGRIAALRAQLRQGGEFDQPFARPDGSSVLLRLRARPLEAGTTVGTGTIWVAEDVTERRRAEHELAEARRQAEAASRAKSEFLATMSHEIRTPLNGVLGLARLLQDPATEAAQRERYVGHLVQSAAQLSGIVSDVLDLSKIEAGRLELEETHFDLHALVCGAFAGFEVLGRERGLAMELQLAPSLPRWVRGDPVRVRQILSNYLGNALKFTEQGCIVLQAAVAGAGRVRLAVRDTGIGIAPALWPRLFRPFGQADNSTTRRFGGTGLGLSICRELAERMGGEVGFDSNGERGSLFWAELPLPAVEAAGSAPGTEPQRPAPLAGRTVLVAEDNPVNLLIVRALLERHGARVVEATNGRAAVALAQQHAEELHAVLMDLHMPELDGLAATRALRSEAKTAALPIHALSAAVLDHDRQAAVAAGMNGFIGKPVSEDELLRALS
jgi:PAS domain S-box-containing protein